MDRQRKNLAEFSRIYLRSFDRAPIGTEIVNEDDEENHVAARVALGMRISKLVLRPRDRRAGDETAFGRVFCSKRRTSSSSYYPQTVGVPSRGRLVQPVPPSREEK